MLHALWMVFLFFAPVAVFAVTIGSAMIIWNVIKCSFGLRTGLGCKCWLWYIEYCVLFTGSVAFWEIYKAIAEL